MRVVIAAAIVLTAAVSAGGCGSTQGDADERAASVPQRVQADGSIKLTSADESALGLVIATAAEAEFPSVSVRFGTVVAPSGGDALIVAPITGRIVTPPVANVGDHVRAGAVVTEVVAVLDAPDQIAIGGQAAERDGQIQAAQSDVSKAEADAARARALSPEVVSAAKVQEAETSLLAARARLGALEQAHSIAKDVQDRRAPVRAPIAGTIVSMAVNVGASVKAGDVLGRVLAPGSRWVDVAVPPDDPTGDGYEIEEGGAPIAARLLARGGLVEPDGTRHDRLVVDEGHASALNPGALVTVHVARGHSRGVVLPDSAVVPGVDTDTVFIESGPGLFVARPVRIGARANGRVRIDSGVKVGDRVVVQGAMALYGERVRGQLRPS